MRLIGITLAALLLACVATWAADAPTPTQALLLATVDTARALEKHPGLAEANRALRAEGEKERKAAEAEVKRMQQETAALRKDLNALPKSQTNTRRILQERVTANEQRVRAVVDGLNARLQQLQAQASARLLQEVREAARRVAQARGIGWVVEASAVVLSPPEGDLTEAVIAELGKPTEKVATHPPRAQ